MFLWLDFFFAFYILFFFIIFWCLGSMFWMQNHDSCMHRTSSQRARDISPCQRVVRR